MRRAPPLRFLALVLGAWLCIRAAILVPGWWAEAEPAAAAASPRPARAPRPEAQAAGPSPARASAVFRRPGLEPPASVGTASARRPAHRRDAPAIPAGPSPRAAMAQPGAIARPPAAIARAPRPSMRRARRWSGSAWLLLRGDRGGPALAPGGTLGGSQAGARLLYRLGGGLALSGRASAPLRRAEGAEAALGLDWRPVPRLPFHLLAERRQRLGSAGRSAFALTFYGGLSGGLPGGLRGEAHAQAGIVGLRRRDPFVDLSVRVVLPVGPVELGGGAWGAAQPGAGRLDAGPHIGWRLPVRGAHFRLGADWRFRVAGDAAPASGPALTLAADF